MRVREIMTDHAAVCSPDTSLREVARMMVEHDCGSIPVVDSMRHKRVIGMITDRDITCRIVARGQNPLELTVASCMSTPCATVTPDDSVEDCCRIMEEHQVRRVPVVDEEGCCCGIVAQADVARQAPAEETAEVVSEISRPVGSF